MADQHPPSEPRPGDADQHDADQHDADQHDADQRDADQHSSDQLDTDQRDALLAALIDLEHHVGTAGWDQPPRLFALVLTDAFAAAEPALAVEMGLRTTAQGAAPGALTAVEQDEFQASGDLLGDLAQLSWPEAVFGCAVSAERTFLPAGQEGDLPEDAAAAAAYVAAHPARQDIRVVVGADRAGHVHGVARLVSQPDQLLGAADLVPGLGAALAHTLE